MCACFKMEGEKGVRRNLWRNTSGEQRASPFLLSHFSFLILENLLLLLTKYREVDVATWARLHVNKKGVGTVDGAAQTVVDTTVVEQ